MPIRGYAEVEIKVNPIGIESATVIGIEGDEDSETMGVEMITVLTPLLHKWKKEARKALCDHWASLRQQDRAA